MANAHAFGNVTVMDHPRDAMGAFNFAILATHINDTVTKIGFGFSCPQPTGIRLINVFPESFFERYAFYSHGDIITRITTKREGV